MANLLNIDIGEDQPVGVHCGSMSFDRGDLILFKGVNLDGGIVAAFAAGHWRKIWWANG